MARHARSATDVPPSNRSPPTPRSRWWWLLVAPYLAVPASVGLLAVLGVGDSAGSSPRSVLALVVIATAGLAHVGLYKDAKSQRTRDGHWSPHYRWYALGGALAAFLGLLVFDVSMPGGLLGAVLVALLLGVALAAPVYLWRRLLT